MFLGCKILILPNLIKFSLQLLITFPKFAQILPKFTRILPKKFPRRCDCIPISYGTVLWYRFALSLRKCWRFDQNNFTFIFCVVWP